MDILLDRIYYRYLRMTQLINNILHTIRHTEGLEHLLGLSFGCRFQDSLKNKGTIVSITEFVHEDLPFDIHYVMDDTLIECETAASEWFEEEMKIIGHPVQWSDVQAAIGIKLEGTSIYFWVSKDGMARLSCADLTNKSILVDLRKTPEQNMHDNPELTRWLADVLEVKE